MKKLVLLSFLLLAESLFAADRPNIIFLMSDDQSTYSIGCYGNDDVVTPEMDRLGMEGIIFDKHYATTAICMASRATTFTGMYEYKTGVNFEHGDMKPDVWDKSYPVLLRETGYLTAFAGKFGFEVDERGLCESDFDFWGGAPGQSNYETAKNESMAKYAKEYPHSTLSYGAFGRDVIQQSVELDKPFCLSISFKAPHRPTKPDPKFDEIYKGKKFKKPANFGRESGEGRALQSKQGRQYERFESWNYDKDYDGVMAIYNQQIYAIDVAIGMIRGELMAQGISENTVIIYTSDNGFICGSHGFGSKVLPMEEASRVPLMIYDPRSENAGKRMRTKQLTGNIDIAPTILDLAGVPIPENMDGKSLVGLLENPDEGGHEQISLINAWQDIGSNEGPITSLTVLDKQYKYTYWWYGDDRMDPTEELFDLEKDPSEFTNVAPNIEYESVLGRMRKKYDEELGKWDREAVDYNDYRKYVTFFDRSIPMRVKEAGMLKSKK